MGFWLVDKMACTLKMGCGQMWGDCSGCLKIGDKWIFMHKKHYNFTFYWKQKVHHEMDCFGVSVRGRVGLHLGNL